MDKNTQRRANANGLRLSLFSGLRPLSGVRAVRDSLAGVELAAMSIPQALGYASIAGMPAVSGFYTLFLPLLAFATFGSSRYLVVAADSATAAILAGGLSPMAPVASAAVCGACRDGGPTDRRYAAPRRLLRLGFLADFLSRTVLVGFLTGVGFQVGIAVLGEMLGLEVHSHRTVVQLAEIARNAGGINLPSLGLSVFVVGGVLRLTGLRRECPVP